MPGLFDQQGDTPLNAGLPMPGSLQSVGANPGMAGPATQAPQAQAPPQAPVDQALAQRVARNQALSQRPWYRVGSALAGHDPATAQLEKDTALQTQRDQLLRQNQLMESQIQLAKGHLGAQGVDMLAKVRSMGLDDKQIEMFVEPAMSLLKYASSGTPGAHTGDLLTPDAVRAAMTTPGYIERTLAASENLVPSDIPALKAVFLKDGASKGLEEMEKIDAKRKAVSVANTLMKLNAVRGAQPTDLHTAALAAKLTPLEYRNLVASKPDARTLMDVGVTPTDIALKGAEAKATAAGTEAGAPIATGLKAAETVRAGAQTAEAKAREQEILGNTPKTVPLPPEGSVAVVTPNRVGQPVTTPGLSTLGAPSAGVTPPRGVQLAPGVQLAATAPKRIDAGEIKKISDLRSSIAKLRALADDVDQYGTAAQLGARGRNYVESTSGLSTGLSPETRGIDARYTPTRMEFERALGGVRGASSPQIQEMLKGSFPGPFVAGSGDRLRALASDSEKELATYEKTIQQSGVNWAPGGPAGTSTNPGGAKPQGLPRVKSFKLVK